MSATAARADEDGGNKPHALRIAAMISGAGSNMLAIDEACRNGRIAGSILMVLSDRPDAPGLALARSRGIDATAIPIESGESRATHDARLLAALDAVRPDLVVLAGYMRILSPAFVTALQDRLLNIHPSLLPRHKGLHTHKRVLEAGEREHGATVHYVTPDLDGGPPVLQARIRVGPSDDPASLAQRVQRCEHVIYPTVLQWIAQGRLHCSDGVPILDGAVLTQPVLQDFDF